VRFLMVMVAAAGIGALTVLGMQSLLPHQSAAMVAALGALKADAARFRLSQLNPIRSIYEDVKTRITSPSPGLAFGGRSTPPITLDGPIKLPKPVQIDQAAINRAIAAGINSQIQQNYQRTQAITQYGRNPMGWHGPPPH
jgi:hypothetical protein